MNPRARHGVRAALVACLAFGALVGGPAAGAVGAGVSGVAGSGVAGSGAGAVRMAIPNTDSSCSAEGPATFVTDPEAMANISALQSPLVWDSTRGRGITIAIVDSGVNGADPRISGALVDGINLVDDGLDPTGRVDFNGHGTALAGLIAARPTESSVLTGLAPGVKIMPIRAWSNTDERSVEAGLGLSVQRMTAGIMAAADAGAEIINVSMSTESASNAIDEAVQYATDRGSLVVASAGNVASDQDVSMTAAVEQLRYPAASPGALGVTATTFGSTLVTDASVHGEHVDIAAPGQNVLTLGLSTGDCLKAQDQPYTSYATAYVSAAAALVAAAHPSETPQQWAYRLMATALRSAPDSRTNLSGWGVVQPLQAATFVPGVDTRGPKTPFFTIDEIADDPEPESMVIAAPSNQHEVDSTRFVLVAVSALSVLALVGAVAAFRTGRQRARRVAE